MLAYVLSNAPQCSLVDFVFCTICAMYLYAMIDSHSIIC